MFTRLRKPEATSDKNLNLALSQGLFKQLLQTLHHYDLHWTWPFRIRFGDLGFISRSWQLVECEVIIQSFVFFCVCLWVHVQPVLHLCDHYTHGQYSEYLIMWCVCVCVLSRQLLQHKFIWFTSGFVSCMICIYRYYRQDNLHYAIFTCTDFLLPALPLPRHCSDNICYLNFMFNNLFRSFHFFFFFFVHFGTALTCLVCVINILFILYGTVSLQNLEKKIEIFLI